MLRMTVWDNPRNAYLRRDAGCRILAITGRAELHKESRRIIPTASHMRTVMSYVSNSVSINSKAVYSHLTG